MRWPPGTVSSRIWVTAGRKPRSAMWSASSSTVMTTRSSRAAPRSMQVDQPAGGGDHEVDPAPQRLDLAAHRRTAVDGGEPDADGVAERSEHVSDLRASSRVGTRTRPRGDRSARSPTVSARRASIGRPKPRVLPEPVWARPRTSRPARASGRVRDWIAKGATIPRRVSAVTSAAGKPELGEGQIGGGRRSRKRCRQREIELRTARGGGLAGAAARPEVRRRGEPVAADRLAVVREGRIGRVVGHGRPRAANVFRQGGTPSAVFGRDMLGDVGDATGSQNQPGSESSKTSDLAGHSPAGAAKERSRHI